MILDSILAFFRGVLTWLLDAIPAFEATSNDTAVDNMRANLTKWDGFLPVFPVIHCLTVSCVAVICLWGWWVVNYLFNKFRGSG